MPMVRNVHIAMIIPVKYMAGFNRLLAAKVRKKVDMQRFFVRKFGENTSGA